MPKPLVDVNGEYMISLVHRNLNLKGQYTFIVLAEHYKKYNLSAILQVLAPGCNIVQVDSVTEGAACTALLAKEFIDSDTPLVIANSDQFVEWDPELFMKLCSSNLVDGAIVCFDAKGSKWSYVRIEESMLIEEVAEKKEISGHATVGIYYFKRGSDFVKAAERMILKEIRTNGEFYVSVVYNEMILDGNRIWPFWADRMCGLGTPEDLDKYLKR